MAYRDRLLPASYRGVAFFVDQDEVGGGKRAQVHEYPERDLPFVEELGRSARSFDVSLHLLGDDFLDQRSRLVEALETPGPGTLVLPTRGEFSAICLSFRSVEAIIGEGRISRLQATFIEAGLNAFPQSLADTREKVLEAAEPGIVASSSRFLKRFVLDALPDWVETSSASGVTSMRDGLRAVVAIVDGPADETATLMRELDDMADGALDLVREPQALVDAFTGSMESLGELQATPRRLYDSLLTALPALDSLGVTDGTTSHRQAAAEQTRALQELYRRNVVLELTRISTRVPFDSREDALAFSDALGGTLLDEITVAADREDDAGVAAMQGSLSAVVTDLEARAKQLPRKAKYLLRTTTPALVVAHRIHGDAERDTEIVARNRVRRPGFVPSGEIEVLIG